MPPEVLNKSHLCLHVGARALDSAVSRHMSCCSRRPIRVNVVALRVGHELMAEPRARRVFLQCSRGPRTS